MHRTQLLVAGVTVLVILSGSACSVAAPIFKITPSLPKFSGGPTSAAASPASVVQTATVASGAAQPPVCQASDSCAAAAAEQVQLDCVKKIPYTNVLVAPGTTFQVAEPSGAFMCVDSNVMVNGKEVITCHGKELYSFELKLTNSACAGTLLTMGTGQCQAGYGFDTAQKCCAPVDGTAAGSAVVRIQLAACPVPNP